MREKYPSNFSTSILPALESNSNFQGKRTNYAVPHVGETRTHTLVNRHSVPSPLFTSRPWGTSCRWTISLVILRSLANDRARVFWVTVQDAGLVISAKRRAIFSQLPLRIRGLRNGSFPFLPVHHWRLEINRFSSARLTMETGFHSKLLHSSPLLVALSS